MIKILKTKAAVAVLVCIITFIVFIPALRNEFTGDDFAYVANNTFIRSLDLNLFKSAFLSFQIANWHPLTWISHAMDYAIWGANPFGHHLTNNIIHALNTFLVVLLVVRLIETVNNMQPSSNQGVARSNGLVVEWSSGTTQLPNFSTSSSFTLIAAATTGLLFSLHPLRVEAVAWVTERKELLCALFFLLSILMYAKYAASISNPVKLVHRFLNKQYLFTVGFFVLALLSKPMAVTLPFVLLILDWYPFKRIHSLRTFLSVLGEKVPFISLSLVASILTIMAQEEGGTIISTAVIPLSTRLLVGTKCLFAYLWKMILPLNLMPAGYPYPHPSDVSIHVSILSLEYLFFIALLTGITIACLVAATKQQLWLTIWIYYIVTLVPVLGIVKAGAIFMADRYSYLPSIGPSLVAGLMTAEIQRKIMAIKQRRLLLEITAGVAGIALLIFLSFLTIKQISLWKNDKARMDYLNRIHLEEAMKRFQKN